MYLFKCRKLGINACIYIYGNTQSAFTTEPLDGCLKKIGRVEVFIAPHMHLGFFGDPQRGKNRSVSVPFSKGLLLQIGRQQQQIECIAVV